MGYDFIDYKNPNSYNPEKDSSMKRTKRAGQAKHILSNANNKTYLVHLLPYTSDYDADGTIKYHVTTNSQGHLQTLMMNGDFEGDYSFESSLYHLLSETEVGGLSDKRIILCGKYNYYSGYITSAAQRGKIITIRIKVKRSNPALPDDIDLHPASPELISIPKNYDLGFNSELEAKLDRQMAENVLRFKK